MSVTNNIVQTVVMGGAGIGTARAVARSTRPALGAAASKIDKSAIIAPVAATGAGVAAGAALSGRTERGYTPSERNIALGTTVGWGIALGTLGGLLSRGNKSAAISAAMSGAGAVGAAFLTANGLGLAGRNGAEDPTPAPMATSDEAVEKAADKAGGGGYLLGAPIGVVVGGSLGYLAGKGNGAVVGASVGATALGLGVSSLARRMVVVDMT